MSTTWMERGACRGLPDRWFFPTNNRFGRAMRVCKQCPVRKPCVQYAVHYRIEYGMWGGTSPKERAELYEPEEEVEETGVHG
jgi:WhiB family redox-sensing transcriptional regulator